MPKQMVVLPVRFAHRLRGLSRTVVLSLLIPVTSCSTVKHTYSGTKLELTHSVFQFAGDGRLVKDLKGVGRRHKGHIAYTSTAQSAGEYIHLAMRSLRARRIPPRHLVVYAHGGLKSFRAGVKKAIDLQEDPLLHVNRPDSDTAFIFLSWNAGLLSTYGESLITNQGQVQPLRNFKHAAFGAALTTGHLLKDIARATFGLPLHLLQYSTEPGLFGMGFSKPRNFYRFGDLYTRRPIQVRSVNRFSGELRAAYVDGSNALHPLRISADPVHSGGAFFYHVVHPLLASGVRLPALWLGDFAGRPAWNSTLRRTQTMFQRPVAIEEDLDVVSKASNRQLTQRFLTRRGIVPQLADSIEAYRQWYNRRLAQQKSSQASQQDSASLTLIGHSMGAIVMSNMLQSASATFTCQNVVYMAAACQLQDFRTKVVPYLQAHPTTQFYNLTLHPYRELTENMVGDYSIPWLLRPVPDGSLLVMIDRVLTDPLTLQERTLGRWHNFVLATSDSSLVPPELRGRITLKAFGAGRDRSVSGPQIHGELTKIYLRGRGTTRQHRYPYFFWQHPYWAVDQYPTATPAP